MKKVIITTGVIALIGGVATALTMSSCKDCEVSEDPTLIATFVGSEANSEYLIAEHVEFEWTDENGKTVSKKAHCMTQGQKEGCKEWGLGQGKSGKYTLHATVCGVEIEEEYVIEPDPETGCRITTQLVDVNVDCGGKPNADAVPEDLDVAAKRPELQFIPDQAKFEALKAKQCTLEARTSVLASTWAERDGKMVPINPDRVFWSYVGEPNEREFDPMCVNSECQTFAAGFEMAGEIIVGAEICGKEHSVTTKVEMDEAGCHVMTQHTRIIGDIRDCEGREAAVMEGLEAPLVPAGEPLTTCLPNVVPSAFVIPVDDMGDFYKPHPTEELIYYHNDERFKAHCALKSETNADACLYWVTGFGKDGRFEAHTETCERDTAILYSVEKNEDNCTPNTQYIYAKVDTTGCITAAWPEGETPEGMGDKVAPK